MGVIVSGTIWRCSASSARVPHHLEQEYSILHFRRRDHAGTQHDCGQGRA